MSSDLMRRYIDILNEDAAAPQMSLTKVIPPNSPQHQKLVQSLKALSAQYAGTVNEAERAAVADAMMGIAALALAVPMSMMGYDIYKSTMDFEPVVVEITKQIQWDNYEATKKQVILKMRQQQEDYKDWDQDARALEAAVTKDVAANQQIVANVAKKYSDKDMRRTRDKIQKYSGYLAPSNPRAYNDMPRQIQRAAGKLPNWNIGLNWDEPGSAYNAQQDLEQTKVPAMKWGTGFAKDPVTGKDVREVPRKIYKTPYDKKPT